MFVFQADLFFFRRRKRNHLIEGAVYWSEADAAPGNRMRWHSAWLGRRFHRDNGAIHTPGVPEGGPPNNVSFSWRINAEASWPSYYFVWQRGDTCAGKAWEECRLSWRYRAGWTGESPRLGLLFTVMLPGAQPEISKCFFFLTVQY